MALDARVKLGLILAGPVAYLALSGWRPLGPLQVGSYLIDNLAGQLSVSTAFAVLGGLTTAGLALALGIPLGLAAVALPGLAGGAFRAATDTLSSLPRYVLVLFLFAIFGKSPTVLVLACGLACAPHVAESVRTHVGQQIADGRLLALTAHGFSPAHIYWVQFVFRSARPLLRSDVLTIMSLFVITEASLGYIDPYVFTHHSATFGVMLSRCLPGVLEGPAAGVVIVWMGGLLFLFQTIRRHPSTPT
jgi:ABC-type dipeptide/oligopeptide/nickel transport system permease subunit